MAFEPGVAKRDLARRLSIGQGVLSRWKRELKRDGQQAFPGKGHLKTKDEVMHQRAPHFVACFGDVLRPCGVSQWILPMVETQTQST